MARRWVNMKLSCNVGTSIGDLYQDDSDTHLHDQKILQKLDLGGLRFLLQLTTPVFALQCFDMAQNVF